MQFRGQKLLKVVIQLSRLHHRQKNCQPKSDGMPIEGWEWHKTKKRTTGPIDIGPNITSQNLGFGHLYALQSSSSTPYGAILFSVPFKVVLHLKRCRNHGTSTVNVDVKKRILFHPGCHLVDLMASRRRKSCFQIELLALWECVGVFFFSSFRFDNFAQVQFYMSKSRT